jgi:hypothetical protein
MAYSVSYHTWRNHFKPLITHGNPIPMGSHFIASIYGGKLMYFALANLFDMEEPKSQSKDDLERAAQYLWKAEYLGLINELFSPYEEPGLKSPIMTPVIVRHMMEGWKSFSKYQADALDFPGITKQVFSNTVPLFSQSLRLIDSSKSELFSASKKANVLKKQFWQDYKEKAPAAIESYSKNQPFYDDLKKAFIGGREEEMAKAYWLAYTFLFKNMTTKDKYHIRGADKAAQSILKGIIKRLNPLNLSSDLNNKVISRRDEFLLWLDKDTRKEMLKYEKLYYYNFRKFWKAVPKYKKTLSPYLK